VKARKKEKEAKAQTARLSQTIGSSPRKGKVELPPHKTFSEQNLHGRENKSDFQQTKTSVDSTQNVPFAQESTFYAKNHANKTKIAEKPIVKQSYNFNYRGLLNATEQKVLETVENSELPITPLEISQKTKINHNSVKVYLRTLKKRNLVVQPYRGEYVSAKKVVTSDRCIGGKVTDKGEVLPRVHNLRFKFSYVGERGIVKELNYDVAKVTAAIGSNGVANVYVACSREGLDFSAYRVLMSAVRRELRVPKDSSVVVTGFELNIDYKGIKLDGVKALTLSAFDGSFERLYQKHRDVLRSEVRPVGPTTPEAIYNLLKGGVGPYNFMQSVAFLTNEIRQYTEAQKFTNRLLVDMLNEVRKIKRGP
jgi:hypothetical protein